MSSSATPVSAEPPSRLPDPQVPPARRGRPRGSSSVSTEQIEESFAALKLHLGRRPTRQEVGNALHVSVDTIDNVLKPSGRRFSDLR